MSEIETSTWFIINTKPKQEFNAEKNLRSLGAEVYLPVYKKKVKKNKEKIEVVSPLFAGYLFQSKEYGLLGQGIVQGICSQTYPVVLQCRGKYHL